MRHPHNLDFYVLPGGHLEWGEDIKKCLQREIVEELGISPEIGQLLYVNNFINKNNVHLVEFFFEVLNSAEYKNIENIKRTHAHEIAEVYWAKPDDSVTILPREFHKDFKTGEVLSGQVKYIHSD